jgi:serine kinase of HPr protein (carbohydrate metabolism regulator)
MAEEVHLHGSTVAVGDAGVILLGRPGAGKSDLALRLIDQPGCGTSGVLRETHLVADDQTRVRRDGTRLLASAPPALHGLLEIRGLGIVTVPPAAEVELRLAVQLGPAGEIERLPDLAESRIEILGIALPLIRIDPDRASAPARIRAALDHLSPA